MTFDTIIDSFIFNKPLLDAIQANAKNVDCRILELAIKGNKIFMDIAEKPEFVTDYLNTQKKLLCYIQAFQEFSNKYYLKKQ